MPRFYFHFQQGSIRTVDTEGNEFDSSETAYLEAFKAAQAMWTELLVARQDPLMCSFEIIDASGNALFTLPFSEVLDVCRGRGERAPCVPALMYEAVESRRRASKTIHDVSRSLRDVRAALQETFGLLNEVDRVARPWPQDQRPDIP